MARNYEKRFSGLNRFLEAKEKEAGKPESRRPQLHKLKTAEEVKKWIPSITREIEYCLQQVAGAESRNYTDSKVKEFQERIDRLEKEHQRFVEGVRALDPSYKDAIPWQPRGYSKKRSHERHMTPTVPQRKKLCSPLLEHEMKSMKEGKGALKLDNRNKDHTDCTTVAEIVHPGDPTPCDTACPKPSHQCLKTSHKASKKDTSSTLSKNVLGLDYSSSDDDRDSTSEQ